MDDACAVPRYSSLCEAVLIGVLYWIVLYTAVEPLFLLLLLLLQLLVVLFLMYNSLESLHFSKYKEQ